MTITTHDTCYCEYCADPENGMFNAETGNHITCDELAALRARCETLEAAALDGEMAKTLLMTLVEALRGIPHDKIGNGSITKEIAQSFLKFANRALPEFGPLTSDTQRTYDTSELSEYARTQVAAQKPSGLQGLK